MTAIDGLTPGTISSKLISHSRASYNEPHPSCFYRRREKGVPLRNWKAAMRQLSNSLFHGRRPSESNRGDGVQVHQTKIKPAQWHAYHTRHVRHISKLPCDLWIEMLLRQFLLAYRGGDGKGSALAGKLVRLYEGTINQPSHHWCSSEACQYIAMVFW